LIDTKIGRLSGGERRYLEVLLILAREQEFAILDEPFSEFEPLYREKVIDLIKRMRNVKGILITDQDYRSVVKVSSSRLLLVDGCLRPFDSDEDLIRFSYLPYTQ